MTEKTVIVADRLERPPIEIIRSYATERTVITSQDKTTWRPRYQHETGIDMSPGTKLTVSDNGLVQQKVVETLVSALSGGRIHHHRLSRAIRVGNECGIHMRPSIQIVDTCEQFMSEILLEDRGVSVNARDIRQVSMLSIPHGAKVNAHAYGPDARELLDALEQLISVECFGEPPRQRVRKKVRKQEEP